MSGEMFDLDAAIARHRQGGWRMVIDLADHLGEQAMKELSWVERRDGITRCIRSSLWMLDRETRIPGAQALPVLIDELSQCATTEEAEPWWAMIVSLADEDRVCLNTHRRAGS